MTTVLAPRTDTTTDTSDDTPVVAHLVPMPAAAITAAYVNGTPLTSLCGHTWVPHRDPEPLPLCTDCTAINEQGI